MQKTNNEATAIIVKTIDERVADIEKKLETIPDNEKTAEIVMATLGKFFTEKGTTVKSIIVTTAVIMGSFAVIFGGLKFFLTYIGFTYIR